MTPISPLLAVLCATIAQSPGSVPAQQGAIGREVPWTWTLPVAAQDSILWTADHEEGSLYDWHLLAHGNAGGGIFNTGGSEVFAVASSTRAHSGLWSAKATITGAVQAMNGPRAVRLMRWTDRAWTDGGGYFPDSAYYSTWVFLPEDYNPNKYAPWDPGDGGWWNIFQFKCDDAQGVSQPMWVLNVQRDDATGHLSTYLYSNLAPPFSHGQQGTPRPLPVGQWVHIEALYVGATDATGRIAIWQDGTPILDVDGVQTLLPGSAEKPVWGIGNYTDHIAGGAQLGAATLYFDDAVVSTLPMHPYLR